MARHKANYQRGLKKNKIEDRSVLAVEILWNTKDVHKNV